MLKKVKVEPVTDQTRTSIACNTGERSGCRRGREMEAESTKCRGFENGYNRYGQQAKRKGRAEGAE